MGCQGSKDVKTKSPKKASSKSSKKSSSTKSSKKESTKATTASTNPDKPTNDPTDNNNNNNHNTVVAEQALSTATENNEKPVKPPNKLKKLFSKDKIINETDKDDDTKKDNDKRGNKSAKVRPMTSEEVTQKIPCPTEVPKAVAYHIELNSQATSPTIHTISANGQTNKSHSQETQIKDESDGGQGEDKQTNSSSFKIKLPRRLPKLSSLGASKDLTSEKIQQKQQKAEKKRREHLEKRKEKARMFLGKIESTKSDSVSAGTDSPKSQDDEQQNSVLPSAPEVSAESSSENINSVRMETPTAESSQDKAWKDLTQNAPMSAQIEAV